MWRIEYYFNQLGGIKNFGVLLGLFILFFFICAVIKNKIVRGVLSLFFSIFLVLQVSSIYFTKTFVGYQYYVHFNLRDVQGFQNAFGVQYIIGICIFFLCFISFYKSYDWYYSKLTQKKAFQKVKNYLAFYCFPAFLHILPYHFHLNTLLHIHHILYSWYKN